LVKLSSARTLGELGSILQLVPFVGIVGYVVTLIAVRYISDELQDSSIFSNMLFAVITGIFGTAVGLLSVVGGAVFAVFTPGISGVAGVFTVLAIAWIVLIISAIFVRRAFDAMARKLNVGTFRTAGKLYLIGAALSIVVVGFVILFVAYAFQLVAFFGIREIIPQSPGGTTDTQSSSPSAIKYCANCGAQMPTSSTFCPSCGAKQSESGN
jgi:uncharacterized membrane protein